MKRILLAEDDGFLRRACETSLRARGYTVVTANDGVEALRLALADPPDLVLLDMLMPRMNGLQVLQALREAEVTRAVPVLIISNSSRQSDIDAVTKLGVAGYLVKANLSLKELGDHVAKLLGV